MTRQMLSAVSSGRMPLWRSTSRRIMSASRAGRNAEPDSCVCLTRDEAVDDLAALHQQAVHRLVDAVDLAPQIGERRCGLGAGRFRPSDAASRPRHDLSACAALIGARPRSKAKKTLTAAPCGLSKPVAAAQLRPVAWIRPFRFAGRVVKMVEADFSVAFDPADRAREADDPAFARRPLRSGQAAAARCRRRPRSLPDRLPDLRHAQCRAQQRGADLPRADRRPARRQPPSGDRQARLVGDHGRSRASRSTPSAISSSARTCSAPAWAPPGRPRPIPRTGMPWGLDFPVITIRDMVRAQAMLLDHLGIDLAVLDGRRLDGRHAGAAMGGELSASACSPRCRSPHRPAIRRRTSPSTRSAGRR